MGSTSYLITLAYDAIDDSPFRTSHRDEHRILLIRKGCIELQIGSKKYKAPKNSVVLLDNLEHFSIILKELGTEYTYIALEASITDTYLTNPELLSILKNHTERFQHCVDVTQFRDQIGEIFQKLVDCKHNGCYVNDLAACYLTELLIILCREYPQLRIHSIDESTKGRILEVQKYLEHHYREQVKISEVCKQYYFSTHYLSHQFKELTGYSPKQYLTAIRLKHAAVMIRDTALPINEIAVACGFSDINNFCKQFKSEYNCTPTSFRIYR